MRARRAALAALVTLMLAAVPVQAITFGQLDDPTNPKYPHVGSMVIVVEGRNESFCTGTLVSSTVFVTAGHCTYALGAWFGIAPDEIYVTFDPVVDQTSTLLPGRYYTHPDFRNSGKRSNPNDVAVVVLDKPVTGVTPASLPRAGLLDALDLRSRRFETAGYGTVREDKTTGPHALYWDPQRRWAEQGFLSLTKAWMTLAMNPSTGNGGTCYGDSGGPHFLAGTSTLVSLTSWGDTPCIATDVTYRLDTPWARDFLDDFVALP